jgi:hypothetical protein
MAAIHVLEADLTLYLFGQLPSHRISDVESHLTECSSCVDRLSDLAEIPFRIVKLSERQFAAYQGVEKRREHRIPTNNPGQMQTFSPFSPTKITVQITDISRNGLRVHTPQFVGRGTVVQVRFKQAIILGEVRYCVADGTEFDAGIQIEDVIPRPSV